MLLCGTKNGSSMASLEEAFEAPLFLREYVVLFVYFSILNMCLFTFHYNSHFTNSVFFFL